MLETVNAFIWGNLLLSLLLGTGVYYTVRMRGFQLRGMGRVLRCTFSGRADLCSMIWRNHCDLLLFLSPPVLMAGFPAVRSQAPAD